jgi:hypothetical protein
MRAVCGMYVFTAPFVPFLLDRLTVRGVSFIAATLLVLGAWCVPFILHVALAPTS